MQGHRQARVAGANVPGHRPHIANEPAYAGETVRTQDRAQPSGLQRPVQTRLDCVILNLAGNQPFITQQDIAARGQLQVETSPNPKAGGYNVR